MEALHRRGWPRQVAAHLRIGKHLDPRLGVAGLEGADDQARRFQPGARSLEYECRTGNAPLRGVGSIPQQRRRQRSAVAEQPLRAASKEARFAGFRALTMYGLVVKAVRRAWRVLAGAPGGRRRGYAAEVHAAPAGTDEALAVQSAGTPVTSSQRGA